MRDCYIIIILALLTGCGILTTAPKKPAPTPAEIARRQTVKIIAVCAEGEKWGSGVAISNEHVLTAAHVVRCNDGGEYSILFKDGTSYAATVDKVDYSLDIARLSAKIKGTIIKPRVAIAVEGETVCSYSAVPMRVSHCGQMVLIDNNPPGNLGFEIPVVSGNSGSGLYNERFELVGIVTHKIVDLFGASMAGLATSLHGRGFI